MMFLAALLGTTAALLVLSAGYLFGAQRGAKARERLWAQNLGQMEELEQERQRLLEQREENLTSLLRKDLVKLLELLLRQGNALQQMLAPLSKGIDEADNLRSTVEQVLSPLAQRERLEWALSNLDTGTGHQSDLTQLLNEVAAKGGFRVVMLSDDQGLTLAHNEHAHDTDRIAGLSSLLLVLAERIAREGAPAPLSLMVHDEENNVILCRTFRIQDTRLLLTAVTTGVELTPTALDPAISKIDAILSC